jgi:hypothetical protein
MIFTQPYREIPLSQMSVKAYMHTCGRSLRAIGGRHLHIRGLTGRMFCHEASVKEFASRTGSAGRRGRAESMVWW